MAISITKYINIQSTKIGASQVIRKDMILRLFTNNALIPPQTLITFSTADEVGTYFGTSSEEYTRAVFYFSFVSKNKSRPQKIQYARFCQTASLPKIFPLQNNGSVLANWTSISTGAFTLTMGGYTATMSALDFTGAANLAAVATIVQTAIQAKTGGGAAWTTATVAYSSSYGGFILTGGTGTTVSQPVIVNTPASGVNITGIGLLGWLPQEIVTSSSYVPGAIWASGSDEETITQALTASVNASSNFASILFLNNLNLTLADVTEGATWNKTQNNEYCFLNGLTSANVSTWYAALNAIGGLGLTISGLSTVKVGDLTSGSPTITNLNDTSDLKVGQYLSATGIPAGSSILAIPSLTSVTMSANASATSTPNITFLLSQYPEQIPSMIAAATNYNTANSVQNYEYQINFIGVTPSVTDTTVATAYDDLRVNYYGLTQTNGKTIAFYQQGFLMGGSTDIIDMGPYYNEIWFKDACRTALLNMQLGLSQVPANNSGLSMISTTLQGPISDALSNGTISVGKELNDQQKADIASITGDQDSWRSVVNNGYVLSVRLVLQGDPAIYVAEYTIIYSEGDSIRKINGFNDVV